MDRNELLKVVDYLTEEKEKYLTLHNDCIRDRNRLIYEGKEGTFELYVVEQRLAKCDGKIELLIKYITKLKNDFNL